jgi:FkbM family methyltransferase
MNTQIRNLLANISRSLPPFKGKTKLGLYIIPLLTNYQSENDCLVRVKMRNGSYMEIDLRSKCEKKSFFTGEYDDAIHQKLCDFLLPGEAVLDIGANIGFYSTALGLGLKKKFNGGKLYAIEPILANYKRLERMIKMNGLEGIVYPFNTALGDMEGTVQFQVEDQDGASTGNAAWLKEGNITVREANCTCSITRLDNFVEEQGIGTCCLIKMDVEGAELDVLTGGQRFIAKTRPIIFSEFNSYCANEFGYSFDDFKKNMTDLCYFPYNLRQGKLLHMEEDIKGIFNVFWIPQEKLKTIS